MPQARDFRSWAARVARQASKEPDATEAQRLMSIKLLGEARRGRRVAARCRNALSGRYLGTSRDPYWTRSGEGLGRSQSNRIDPFESRTEERPELLHRMLCYCCNPPATKTVGFRTGSEGSLVSGRWNETVSSDVRLPT
jgi:hypothetical protein